MVFHGKPEHLLDEIEKNKPRAVGFSCDFDNVRIIEDMSGKIKERWGIPVVVGGPQSIALGRDFLEKAGLTISCGAKAKSLCPDCSMRS